MNTDPDRLLHKTQNGQAVDTRRQVRIYCNVSQPFYEAHEELDAETILMVASSSTGSGGKFLAERSGATRARQSHIPISTALIVEDEKRDSDRLVATLNLMYGYGLDIKTASTLSTALDAALQHKPDIIFLDDVLKPSDNANDTIPYLRHAGYDGPIVVISSRATRKRKAELVRSGATDVIHKDDVDSVRISEALNKIFKIEAAAPSAEEPENKS